MLAGTLSRPGVGVNWEPCPEGTYSNIKGLKEEDQCISCPEGVSSCNYSMNTCVESGEF